MEVQIRTIRGDPSRSTMRSGLGSAGGERSLEDGQSRRQNERGETDKQVEKTLQNPPPSSYPSPSSLPYKARQESRAGGLGPVAPVSFLG